MVGAIGDGYEHYADEDFYRDLATDELLKTDNRATVTSHPYLIDIEPGDDEMCSRTRLIKLWSDSPLENRTIYLAEEPQLEPVFLHGMKAVAPSGVDEYDEIWFCGCVSQCLRDCLCGGFPCAKTKRAYVGAAGEGFLLIADGEGIPAIEILF